MRQCNAACVLIYLARVLEVLEVVGTHAVDVWWRVCGCVSPSCVSALGLCDGATHEPHLVLCRGFQPMHQGVVRCAVVSVSGAGVTTSGDTVLVALGFHELRDVVHGFTFIAQHTTAAIIV